MIYNIQDYGQRQRMPRCQVSVEDGLYFTVTAGQPAMRLFEMTAHCMGTSIAILHFGTLV